jgi:hypothetical protein
MPSLNEAAENVATATELASQGRLTEAFRILRGAYPQPTEQATAVGDDRTSPGDEGTSPGDGHSRIAVDADYPSVPWTSGPDGPEPYWPHKPPFYSDPIPQPPPAPAPSFQLQPGWYHDPFDGVGLRWWNGLGWTSLTHG